MLLQTHSSDLAKVTRSYTNYKHVCKDRRTLTDVESTSLEGVSSLLDGLDTLLEGPVHRRIANQSVLAWSTTDHSVHMIHFLEDEDTSQQWIHTWSLSQIISISWD